MSSVGPYLRELRERHGVSLEEISRTTRVGRSYLEALEAGDFSKLPAPVFTRGFVLAYCQALGESPEEALARYAGGAPEAAAEPATTMRERSRGRGTVLVSFVLLVVLGLALFAVALVLQSGRETAGERRGENRRGDARPAARATEARGDVPANTTVPAGVSATTVEASRTSPPASALTPSTGPASTLEPAMTASSTSPTGVVKPVPPPAPVTPAMMSQQEITATVGSMNAPYRLVARTTAQTWMRVRTDDGHQSDETIPAGQVREWVSNRPFTISIGNAGGVRLELNGRPLPPLGTSGAVITRIVLPAESP